jgi:rubrerythrin
LVRTVRGMSNAAKRAALREHSIASDPTDDAAWARAEFARIDARLPRRLRRLIPTTCAACGHDFLVDSTDLAPEGCPECHAVQS